MPTTFRFALLSAVIAQSLTALATSYCPSKPPDAGDLEVAEREMKRFDKPVVFKPEASDFIYVKDSKLDLWIINSFVIGKGAQGCVSRAWKAAVGVPPAETSQFVVKIIDVNESEDFTKLPYTNEIEALEALNREHADVLVIKVGKRETEGTKGVVHYETKCNKVDKRAEYGTRCKGEAEAYIFQPLIKGTTAALLKIYYNQEAINDLQKGLSREIKELHSKGWVHGDATLFNFLADETGIPNQYNVKAIDFGLSFRDTAAADLEDDSFKNVAVLLTNYQFTEPFRNYFQGMKEIEKDSESKWSPMKVNMMEEARVNELQRAFGHVEDWEIKLAHLGALNEFDVPFAKESQYYETLFEQIMSPRALNDAVSPEARTVRLLKDAELAKSSFETVYQKLMALGKGAMLQVGPAQLTRAEEYVKALSQEIVRLQASLGIVEDAVASIPWKYTTLPAKAPVGASTHAVVSPEPQPAPSTSDQTGTVPDDAQGSESSELGRGGKGPESDNRDAQSIPGKNIKLPAKAPVEASTHDVSPKPQPAPSTSDQTGTVPDHAGKGSESDNRDAQSIPGDITKLPAKVPTEASSSNSFSGSFRETMSLAAATTLVCFALATFSV